MSMCLTHSIKVHEAKTDRTKRRNRRIDYQKWRLQHLSGVDRHSIQKISTDIVKLNATNELNIIDINNSSRDWFKMAE